ncbi:MAG: hypothetical protein AB1725_05845 [Armatimonadota bacterium]
MTGTADYGGARLARPERKTTAAQFNEGLLRAGAERASSDGGQWRHLLSLVCAEYAYCTMYGVNIVDGNIVSCANIQRSLTFGPAKDVVPAPPAFDEYWQALRDLCARVRNGRLAELRFSRARPIAAKTSEGGRRFKRLVKPLDAGESSPKA